MKHPYADILIAIAKGEEIHWQNSQGVWIDQPIESTLVEICGTEYEPECYRAKPSTIVINGVKCEAPVSGGQFALDIGKCTVGLFATQVARDAAFAALIKPFSEHSHEAR